MLAWKFSSAWSRYFGLAAAPMGKAAPSPSPQERWLRTLAAHLPLTCRALLTSELRLALRLRQHWGRPDHEEQPALSFSRQRFGIHGEELLSLAIDELRQRLKRELREALRTLEAPEQELCCTTRNWRLAMHCARIGQLYQELARPRRGLNADQELFTALSAAQGISS